MPRFETRRLGTKHFFATFEDARRFAEAEANCNRLWTIAPLRRPLTKR